MPEDEGTERLERLVRVEAAIVGLQKSVDQLPARFDRLETDVRNAAREDRAQHDLAISKVQDSFMALVREERERHKEHMLEMRRAYDEKLGELKPIKNWVVMAMGGLFILAFLAKPLIDKLLGN